MQSFLDGLTQSRMSMHVPRNLMHGQIPLLSQSELRKQLGDIRPDEMPPDQFPILGITDQLDEPTGDPQPLSLPVGGEGELRHANVETLLPGLLFGPPETGELRLAVSSPRNHRE